MKQIIAIIRMNQVNATRQALVEAGIPAFTARKVKGRGQGKVDFHLLKGAEDGYEEAISQLGPGPRLVPKRMFTIAVPDELVPKTVKTLIQVNQTGHPGDGKIFVVPLLDAVRIRTGEKGELALDESSPALAAKTD